MSKIFIKKNRARKNLKTYTTVFILVWVFLFSIGCFSSSLYSAEPRTKYQKKVKKARKTKVKISNSIRRIHQVYDDSFQMIQVDIPWVFDNGILFTYGGDEVGATSYRGLEVYISGSFFDWIKKEKLIKNKNGIYEIFISLPFKSGRYQYRFWVNGIWVNDQEQSSWSFDKMGQKVGYFVLNEEINPVIAQSPRRVTSLTYRFLLKDNGYKNVFWVSSLNNWNPYLDKMQLSHGYWVIERPVNKQGLYFFMVDGKKMLDPLNLPSYNNNFGFEANIIIKP